MIPKGTEEIRRTAKRQAKREHHHGLVQLASAKTTDSKFLGATKSGPSYEQQLASSMARYSLMQQKRVNLFAFIMPAGHGKTTLAQRYGFVDVDLLITDDEHDYFVEMRRGIMLGHDTWTKHNSEWYGRLNKTLDLLDYTEPVIIMVHTEEAAMELGAVPLGMLKLEEEQFEKNIRRRRELDLFFSRKSYETCRCTHRVPNQIRCVDNAQLESYILRILNVSGMPVACPFKYTSSIWNNSYHAATPTWVLRGERAGDRNLDVNYLKDLFEKGWIPKECVDYYVKASYVPTQFDFGVTMFDWSRELAHIPPVMGDMTKFDVRGDMMKIFPPRGSKELTRANVTVRQLVKTFDIFSHPDALEIAEHHVGDPQTFVASILSTWKGVTQNTAVADLFFPFFKIKFRHWSDRFKNLHSLIRCSRFFMNTEIEEKDRQGLMYMDLLVGRAEYRIDEMAEVLVRSGDTYDTRHLSYDPDLKLFTNEQYKKDFEKALAIAYSRVQSTPRPINISSFVDFYEKRRSWLTKGGLVYNKMPPGMKEFTSQVLDPIYETVMEIQGRHNKKSLFEMHDLASILTGATAENFNFTKTMIKYETGCKERVLLPGTLVHFLVFSYVLVLAEKQEQIGSVRLNDMGDVDIRYFDRKMSTGIYHVLYDWADFNEQHSAWEMGKVIEGLKSTMNAGQDYSMFCDALVQGMYQMGLQDREGHVHKIWRGLYSGWRGTTWINSVLNFIYTAIALMCLQRICGQQLVLMVDHGGDDLDLMISDPKYMTMFLEIMDNMLFKANKWKQMFGTRSEFFRNTISGATVYASPTRALASFVAGDWEGAGRATIRERVVSLLDQIGKLRRRGVSDALCQGFTMSTISHWCKVKEDDEWMNLPDVVLHGVEEQGGLGIPDKYNHVWVLDREVPEMSEDWYKVVVPDYKASKDYVGVLSKEVERFSLVLERREELAKKLAEDSYDIEKSVDRLEWKKLLGFEARVVDTRPVIEPMEDEGVFEAFTHFEVDEDTERKFSKASRYQEYIGYLHLNGTSIGKEELVRLMSDGEVSVEAIEFSGDPYYQRLVPEFIAHRALMFCRIALNQGVADQAAASSCFKILCWMGRKVFGHMI